MTNATAYDEDLVETLADVLIARGVAYPRGMVYATDILARLAELGWRESCGVVRRGEPRMACVLPRSHTGWRHIDDDATTWGASALDRRADGGDGVSLDIEMERDVLRRAAERFERAAMRWFEEPDGYERRFWLSAYRTAAVVLAAWAMNDGVPPLKDEAGPRADLTSDPEVTP